MPLRDRQLSKRIVRVLASHNINTIAELLAYKKREISDLKGIGNSALQEIIELVNSLNLDFAPDPFAAYNCFRHNSPHWDAKSRLFFLCDDCLPNFQKAMNNNKPICQLSKIEGTCNQCNRHLLNINPTWWILCEVCDRVSNSIGRGVESQRYAHERTKNLLSESRPESVISVDSLDIPVLNAVATQNDENDEGDEQDNISPDLLIKENDEVLFYIEVKTGQSSIGKTSIGPNMNRFQLDHQDIDSILECIRTLEKPVFVYHVQCINRTDGATNRHEPVDCWWATTNSLRDNYLESKTRPRETKTAAYFNINAFRKMEDLPDYLSSASWKSWLQECEAGNVDEIYEET